MIGSHSSLAQGTANKIMRNRLSRLILFATSICLLIFAHAFPARGETEVRFQEVFSLVRSNMPWMEPGELEEAAIAGFLKEVNGRMVVSQTNILTTTVVSKTAVYENRFGYIRIDQVQPGLALAVREEFARIASSNQVKGLVLDLRNSSGRDYEAAAELVDIFVSTQQPVLTVGEKTITSSSKTEVIDIPVAVLVNARTAGAAEAAAAALRHAQVALLIGTNTKGGARVYQELTLSNSQKIEIPSAPVSLPGGALLPKDGVVPDVTIDTPIELEEKVLKDPYAEVGALFHFKGTNVSGNGANRMRRPSSEAELVRLHRQSREQGNAEPLPEEISTPRMTDPALVRALDFLKGVSIVQQFKGN
ncbi:MAG: S41 family peptidase [Verrucomicrobiota bacterium]|nr:S41 family peptidase [Verrucomicrobiota bacterium]